MADVRILQRSFAGGEMSPKMFGRIDDQKYQSGAASVRNNIVRPQGPVENRPGFKLVREVKDSTKSTRLLDFTYSTSQTMCIEMGHEYFRFHTAGATVLSGGSPYEISSPYQEEELFEINYVQSSDVMTLTHPNHAPRELRRLGAASWQLITIDFTSPIASPAGLTVTANTDPLSEKYDYEYVVTAFDEDGIGESEPSSSVSDTGNLLQTGGTVDISWTAVTGATKYRVYKLQGGIYGYIGETEGTSLVDDNIAPDLGISPPTYDSLFGSTDNYPATASYFEQRRTFAGTTTEPQTIWMTKSGTESNFSFSLPIRSDDRIKFRVAARQANTIRHIIPTNDLLLMTSSGEWRVTSVNSDAITPTTISVRPQSSIGASQVQPVIVNNTVIFAAARGGHVREMGYNYEVSGYITGDLCLRTEHLFNNYTIVQTAYSKAPDPIVWCISSSGNLLGITYVPDQRIGAWHRHDTTNGVFESCAVVAEGVEDVLYVVTKRTIDGSTVRFIERLETRDFENLEDCFFVDCGATFDARDIVGASETVRISGDINDWDSGVNLVCTQSLFDTGSDDDIGDDVVIFDGDDEYRCTVLEVIDVNNATVLVDKEPPSSFSTAQSNWAFARDTISGLDWLEGETVSILSDGAVQPQQVVTSGVVPLSRPGILVHVGLPIEADIETLPLSANVQDGSFAQGRRMNPSKIWLRVYRSSGIFVGPDESTLVEQKQRTTEAYGEPPALNTGEERIQLTKKWTDNGQILIRQSDPLPLSIIGITLEVEIG